MQQSPNNLHFKCIWGGEIVHANGKEDGLYAAWQRTTFRTILFSPLNGFNLLNKDVARKQEVEGK